MTHPEPLFDAVVLAGGRSSRLGGVAKAGLVLDGETLLQRTCRALVGARSLTVVGPRPDGTEEIEPVLRAAAENGAHAVPRLAFVREEPPFAGPAAALAAAFALGVSERSSWSVVVACDMPGVPGLLEALLAEARSGADTSLVALDGGRVQPLAALYRTGDLAAAIDGVLAGGSAANLSMRSLLASVRTRQVPVPPGTTHDVDTWADARELGVAVP